MKHPKVKGFFRNSLECIFFLKGYNPLLEATVANILILFIIFGLQFLSQPLSAQNVYTDHYRDFDPKRQTFKFLFTYSEEEEQAFYWKVTRFANGTVDKAQFISAGIPEYTLYFSNYRVVSTDFYRYGHLDKIHKGLPNRTLARDVLLDYWETDIFNRTGIHFYYQIFFDRQTLKLRRVRLLQHHTGDVNLNTHQTDIEGPMIVQFFFDAQGRFVRQEDYREDKLYRVQIFNPDETITPELQNFEDFRNANRKPLHIQYYKTLDVLHGKPKHALPRGLALRGEAFEVIVDARQKPVLAKKFYGNLHFQPVFEAEFRFTYDYRDRLIQVEHWKQQEKWAQPIQARFMFKDYLIRYNPNTGKRSQVIERTYYRNQTLANASKQIFEYDGANKLQKITHFFGLEDTQAEREITQFEYDDQGRKSKVEIRVLAGGKSEVSRRQYVYEYEDKTWNEASPTAIIYYENGREIYTEEFRYAPNRQKLVETYTHKQDLKRNNIARNFYLDGKLAERNTDFPGRKIRLHDRFDVKGRLVVRRTYFQENLSNILLFNKKGDVVQELQYDPQGELERDYRFQHAPNGAVTKIIQVTSEGRYQIFPKPAQELPEKAQHPVGEALLASERIKWNPRQTTSKNQ